MKRVLIFFSSSLVVLAFLFIVPVLLPAADSTLPKEANNWLQNAPDPDIGDQDGINVIFFEVPDTVTSTLYFGVNDPGTYNNNTTLEPGEHDQRAGAAGTVGTSYFYLLGGSGCLSDPVSRQLSYVTVTTAISKGTQLSSFTRTTQNAGWDYFAGVSPTQGEHIGSKYYFKIVVYTAPGTADYKNGYQVDISLSGVDDALPTSITAVKTFAYSWPLIVWDVGINIYPFVPEGEAGNIAFNNMDLDCDNAEITNDMYILGYNKTDQVNELNTPNDIAGGWPVNNCVTRSTDSFTYENPVGVANVTETATEFSIGSETDGTWRLYAVDSGLNTFLNNGEFWFTNSVSGKPYRAYSSNYTPTAPDHVAVNYQDGIAIHGTTMERIYFQIVDSSGEPSLYVRNLHVILQDDGDLSCTVNAASNVHASWSTGNDTITIITDNDGLAWIDIEDTEAENVTILVETDGNNDSTNLTNAVANESVVVQFMADPAPTISSVNNLTFVENSTAFLPQIVLGDTGTSNIVLADSYIYINIPAGLDAHFNIAITTPTFGGTNAGRVNGTVSYPDDKNLRIDLNRL